MNSLNWGDVPTWLAAVFAGGAALFAYLTIKSQREQIGEQRVFIGEQSATLALERAELRAAAEERRWAQARQVQMYHHKTGSTTDSEGNPAGDDKWIVTVLNSSDAPVHRVDLRFGTAYLADEVHELAPTAVHNLGAMFGERLMAPVDLLGAGRAARFLSQRWPSATVHNNRPKLTFTDGNGVRWSLDSHGKLEEVPPEPTA